MEITRVFSLKIRAITSFWVFCSASFKGHSAGYRQKFVFCTQARLLASYLLILWLPIYSRFYIFERWNLHRQATLKQCCENDHFQKEQKIISNWIYWTQSFNYYFIIFSILLNILRGTIVKPQKIFKDTKRHCFART